MIKEVSILFASKKLEYWEQLLDGADCYYQAVLDYHETMSHPQIKNRTLFFNSNFDCQIIWPGLSKLGDVKLRRPCKIIKSKDVKKIWL